jgi:hypothetical protein
VRRRVRIVIPRGDDFQEGSINERVGDSALVYVSGGVVLRFSSFGHAYNTDRRIPITDHCQSSRYGPDKAWPSFSWEEDPTLFSSVA